MPQMPGLLRRLWWFLTKGKQRLGSNASPGVDNNENVGREEKNTFNDAVQLEEAGGDPRNLTAVPVVEVKN